MSSGSPYMHMLLLLLQAEDDGENSSVDSDLRHLSEHGNKISVIFQFIGFLVWYLILILCCFIPPCIIYRRRRILLQNHARLRQAIQELAEQEQRSRPTEAEVSESARVLKSRQITEALQSTTMTVTAEDLIEKVEAGSEQIIAVTESKDNAELSSRQEVVDDEAIVDVTGLDSRLLQLGDMPNGSRQVIAVCIICLCSYEIGDSISISSNPQCSHAFHTDCAVMWLSKQTQALCPCCRQEFCSVNGEAPVRASEAALFWHIRT